jgi:hypothetical protein
MSSPMVLTYKDHKTPAFMRIKSVAVENWPHLHGVRIRLAEAVGEIILSGSHRPRQRFASFCDRRPRQRL